MAKNITINPKKYSATYALISNKTVEAMATPKTTPRRGKRARANMVRLNDSKIAGFHVRSTHGGTKTFYYYYRMQNKGQGNFKIGSYPEMGADAARRIATKKAGDVANNINPSAAKKADIKAGTFKDYSDKYQLTLLKTPTRNKEIYHHTKYLIPHYGKIKLKSILPTDVELLRNKMEKTPAQANQSKIYAHKFFKWCVKNKFLTTNPAADIAQFPSNKREFYFTDTQFAQLSNYLKKKEEQFPLETYFIALMVATGCRPEELFKRPWSDISFENSHMFNIPSKTGRITKTLSPEAIRILKKLIKYTGEYKWLFPSPKNPKNNRKDFRTYWYALRDELLEKKDQMRDIRHHFAVNLLRRGVDIATVSKLMNHASIKTTADHYAHVITEVQEKAHKLTHKSFKLL